MRPFCFSSTFTGLVVMWAVGYPQLVQAQDPCAAVRQSEAELKTAFENAVSIPRNPGETATGHAERIVSTLLEQRATGDDARFRNLLRCLLRDIPESSLAHSASSNASNPQATNLVERSGFTDLLSLALDAQDFLAADENAITVNLSALALRKIGKKSDKEGAFDTLAAFREASPWRRVGGSFTFGAELPKKDIVGFSGLPAADELFDAISWDLKVRIFGDRDPRAKRWAHLPARVGMVGNASAVAQSLIPSLIARGKIATDLVQPLQQALEENLGGTLEAATQDLRQSWQVTLKSSGQHLQGMAEANKYSFTLLADRGIGPWDFTLNATYSRASAEASEDAAGEGGSEAATGGAALAAASSGDEIERIENLEVNLGLTRSLLRDVFVKDREAELSFTGRAVFPLDEKVGPAMAGGMLDAALKDRSEVWKANLTLSLPIGAAGKIPLSLTYTNDPDALADQDYVEGRIGISWDFKALKAELNKPKADG